MPNLQTFERAEYQQVKADLHRKILDRLDLEKLGRTPSDAAREEVLLLIRNTVNSEAVPLSFAERERLSREILDEIFGLGPLEPLLKDPDRKSTRLNSSHQIISYAVLCLKKKITENFGMPGVKLSARFSTPTPVVCDKSMRNVDTLTLVCTRAPQ